MGGFLVLEGVSKRFASTRALEAIDLVLQQDELLVILGPTGAGKTTLLRVIAGLESIEEGRISMAGQDLLQQSPAARDVALVFQNFSLYPDWSVRRNLEFPLQAPGRGLQKEEIEERVKWAAELLRINYLLDRKAVQLSGGEMQRVAIGRAIVRRPRLFLLDEPLTNLDAKLRETLRVELVVLRRQLGIPMIYVTHDQSEALSMGDRIVVLAGGKILQVGHPEEVYRRPVSPQVARQLGQPAINLLEVHRAEDHWVTDRGVEVMPAKTGETKMLLGARPEDIAPVGGKQGGRIRVVEDTGPGWILLVDWAGHSIRLLVGKGKSWHPGDEVFPQIDAERAMLWQREDATS